MYYGSLGKKTANTYSALIRTVARVFAPEDRVVLDVLRERRLPRQFVQSLVVGNFREGIRFQRGDCKI